MSNIMRDKNKSLHKLEGFGPVYCINLDDHVEHEGCTRRRAYVRPPPPPPALPNDQAIGIRYRR